MTMQRFHKCILINNRLILFLSLCLSLLAYYTLLISPIVCQFLLHETCTSQITFNKCHRFFILDYQMCHIVFSSIFSLSLHSVRIVNAATCFPLSLSLHIYSVLD